MAGPTYSFGIWHDQLDEALTFLRDENLKVKKLHCHIGAGNDPEEWLKSATELLQLIA